MNGHTDPQPSAAPPRRGWFGRNWKWVVPLGCLGTLAVFFIFIGGIVAVVFGAMKSSDVYQNAVTQAKESRAVSRALGSPVREGLFVSGSTKTENSYGSADLAIPLKGPKHKGTLYVVATRSAGEWTYSKLVVDVAGTGERIDLLTDTAGDDSEADDGE